MYLRYLQVSHTLDSAAAKTVHLEAQEDIVDLVVAIYDSVNTRHE